MVFQPWVGIRRRFALHWEVLLLSVFHPFATFVIVSIHNLVDIVIFLLILGVGCTGLGPVGTVYHCLFVIWTCFYCFFFLTEYFWWSHYLLQVRGHCFPKTHPFPRLISLIGLF